MCYICSLHGKFSCCLKMENSFSIFWLTRVWFLPFDKLNITKMENSCYYTKYCFLPIQSFKQLHSILMNAWHDYAAVNHQLHLGTDYYCCAHKLP